MSIQTGSVPLSANVLSKSGIGLWAMELDKGCKPRMYADGTMLGLLGLEHPVSPEETYRAWVNGIDRDSCDVIQDAYKKILSGERAEAQYPWHHPDGRTLIVRCGGARVAEYTKGIRIEGSHQDITELQHIDDEQEKKKEESLTLLIMSALSEAYATLYYIEPESGAYQLITRDDVFGHKINSRLVNGGNFYRDCAVNIPALVYEEDRGRLQTLTDRSRIEEAFHGGSSFSIEHRVMVDGTPVWYCAKVVRISGINGIMHYAVGLSRIEEQRRTEQKLKESQTFSSYFLNAYAAAYYVNLKTKMWSINRLSDQGTEEFPLPQAYTPQLTRYIDNDVYPEDRETVSVLLDPDEIRARLNGQNSFSFTVRLNCGGEEKHVRSEVIRGADDDHVAFGFMDITEEVREQRRQLLGAIPLSPDILSKANIGLWAFELDEGRAPRMYVDEAMLRLIGLEHQVSPEETYHAWYDHIDEGSYGLVADAVEKMVSGEHAEVQYPWHHPNGHTMIVRCGGVRNPGYTKGIRIEGTHQDVTATIHYDEEEAKRQRAKEQELTHAEFRASALGYLNGSEGDISSYLSFFASRLRELIGCDQVICKRADGSVFVNCAPDLGEEFKTPPPFSENCIYYDPDSGLYKDGVLEIPDTRVMHGGFCGSRECPVKSLLARVIVLNGKPSGYLTIHYIRSRHEFTDYERRTMEEFAGLLSISLSQYYVRRKSAELEHNLANQLRQIKSFGDMVNAALWHIRINGANEVIGVRWSDEFRHMLGFEQDVRDFPDELDSWMSRLHPDDRERSTVHFYESITSRNFDGFVYDIEYRLIRKNGEACWYHAVGRMEDSGDGIRTMYGIFYDISSEKQLEKHRLQLSEALSKAEAANKSKTEFLFNMSHDIRTPMNAILGYTDIALNHGNDTERVRDCLNKIKLSGDHLLSLINDILEMSRIEAGKLELIESPINVYEVAASVSAMSKALAVSKGVNFEMTFGELRNPFIYADELHVNQVLINLISNAIKYTPADGNVRYHIEQITAPTDGRAEYRFTVSDDGIGMSEEFQAHLFESFTRENTSANSRQEGAGLGLSIVKKIVDLAGGTVTVQSRKGKGSTFVVVLPFRLQKNEKTGLYLESGDEEHTQTAAAGADVIGDFSGKRFLLVEDNELNREIAGIILGEAGLIIEQADNGKTAVHLLKEKGPDYYDAVLMDIQMPVMNGYEATRAIRELYPDASLPIIALSANAFAEDKAASLAAGMNDHIAKPIDKDELFRVLTKFI